ncbi:MAG: isoprenylcysteine carboxylmethyltransferase family protein [Myxococcota bacterium]
MTGAGTSTEPHPGLYWHRSFDIALGLSALSWAGLGLTAETGRPLSVRIALAALNITVAALFLFRTEARLQPGLRAMLAALPSMVCAGAAIKFARQWHPVAEVLFTLGASGAVVSLCALGRSFAFFPAKRGLVERGPYRWLRHPAYAAELLMVLACALVAPWPSAPLALGAAAFVGLRIRAEERLLSTDDDYQAYCKRVRYRLIPPVW